MRVFCAIRHSIDPRHYYGNLWTANFYPAILEMGHEVIESQTDLLPASQFMDVPGNFTKDEREVRARITEHILEEVRIAHRCAPIDLFLSHFYNSHFDPGGFDEIRRTGIPSVNFYCNSIYQFELVETVAAKVDFAWHAEKDARKTYLNLGANPVWVQMAADPRAYGPIPGIRRAPSACFVGQRYADRDRWMALLISAGTPVEIYGPGWGFEDVIKTPKTAAQKCESAYLSRRRAVPGSYRSYVGAVREDIRGSGFASGVLRMARRFSYRRETRALTPLFKSSFRGPILPEEIATVLARHEVCLNFSNVWSDGHPGSRLIPHVRLRDFEAPMCRTCYLTGHTEEITEFYDVGREIDTYRSGEELVDKSKFYLRHSDAAEKMRDAGYRRALRDHTWRCRFEELFRKIGLSRAC
jgi:spore maturation protein CgeB